MDDPSLKISSPAAIFKIVLIYALFAGLWITVSDWAVEQYLTGTEIHAVAQSIKGWLFVAVTATLLFFLLTRLIAGKIVREAMPHMALLNWPRWQLYLLALALSVLTLVIRQDIAVSYQERPLLLLFMFPIVMSAILGGFGPGLLATALSVLGLSYFAIPPTGSFTIEKSHDLLQMGFLAVVGLLVSYLSMMLHDARYRSERERQKADSLLMEKNRALQLLEGISDGSSDAIFAKDTNDRFILFNPAAERFTGKSAAQVLGHDETAIFPPEIAARIIADNRRVMEENKTITFHDEIVTVDGDRTFLDTKGPLHDAEGNVIGMFGIARDITGLRVTEQALRRERDTNQRYLDSVLNIMLALDDIGRVTMINRYGCELLGYGEKELLGEQWFKKCLPQPAGMEVVYPLFRRIIAGDLAAAEYHENEVLCRDGSRRLIAWHNGYFKNDAGNIVGTLSSGEDITARAQAEHELRKLSMAVEQSPECIAITDLDANIEYVNEAFVRTSGYSREELIGQNPRIHHSGKTPKETYDALWKSLSAGEVWQGLLYNRRKDGGEYTVHAIISPIREADGHITHYVAVEEDLTDKQRSEAEIHRLAFYDPLTGLPNRALLLERLTQMLSMTRRSKHFSALITFNIDRFKTINDAGGQALGDALLQAVGIRLCTIIREGDVVARSGGDEFGIMLADLGPDRENAAHFALHVAEKIHSSLYEAFLLGSSPINLSACLGIALFPDAAHDAPLDIMRRVNTALHHAKSRGDGQTAFFEGSLDEAAHYRFEVERDLHRALVSDELRVYLQLQVDASGKPVGAEALVRWQHPQRGLIAPGAFIPIAEESNLIIEIGNWVLGEVCAMLAREDMAGCTKRIAVNISPRHFRQPDFVDQVRQALGNSGADPTRLTLEVTEGMLIDNLNDVIAKMNELSAMGIHFSMDDFGTGYSSLAYLKRLPFNELKIDKTFVQDITTDTDSAALVEAILAVAKLMRLSVVAEGVETEEQAAFLNQRGKVFHQGYLYSMPGPAEAALTTLLKSSR